MAYARKRYKVTYSKGRRRFTRWYKSTFKAIKSKRALFRFGWKSSNPYMRR
mgnify:CR=1 FL=1